MLLIMCANLATLTLARATGREREIAVRAAIGASRLQVVSQVLIENLILAVAGAALAVPVALLVGRALVALLNSPANPVVLNITADTRLIVFVGALLALTPLIFAAIPALTTSFVDPIAVMRQSSRGVTIGRHRARFQRGLVVGQIAVSMVLLVSAVLFVRTFRNLTRVETGLDLRGAFAVRFLDREADAAGLSLERRVSFQQRLTDEIASIPGIAGAVPSTFVPLAGGSWFHFFRVPSLAGGERQASRFTYVGPGYFVTLHIPILAGRDFRTSDNAGSRRVILVNEQFVQSHLRGRSPIGTTIRTVAEAGYPEITQIALLLLRDSLWLLATGIVIGVPIAAVAMRGASALLFGLSPTDLATMVMATFLVAAPAGLAALIPAWRAARLNPDVALRSE